MSPARDESAGDPGLFPAPPPPPTPPPRAAPGGAAPLAERMRPATLAEVVGQETVLGPGTFLAEAAAAGRVPSLVLWGPPGSGKTTIARALAVAVGGSWCALSAVTSCVKDVRAVIEEAQARRSSGGRTILFVDEIHRFNKAQQDAFLPHVESGTVVLVGATTENPAFALTPALLSRLRVVVLETLSKAALSTLVDRATADPLRGLGGRVRLAPDARLGLLTLADGDARRCLNALEAAAARALARGEGAQVTLDDVREASQRRLPRYDRGGDVAYDALSAFHKSLRGSDPDAALYWLARMLEGGEDPLVPVRRMVAMACEDVGLADRDALRVALEALEAVRFLGLPEGELALVRAVVYLAAAPKSNAVVLALAAAHEAAKAHPDAPVPIHLRSAPTALDRSLGHGQAYLYPHDHANAFVLQDYLPDALVGTRLYEPIEVGDEREIARRVAWWRGLRERARGAADGRPSSEKAPGGESR
jgi:putative ATPase